MKVQEVIDSIRILLAELPPVSALDNDPMRYFTSAVETKLLATLTQKMGDNPQRELSKEDVDDLIALQREWFEVIAGSDEIPCHAPRSRLTALSLVLAQLIESAVGKSRYEILLPTVQTINYEASGASVKDDALQLTEFILTDDNKSMIEVLACLDCASDSGELKHTFLDNGQVKLLSAAEKQRVINHSAEAKAYWEAIQHKQDVTLRGDSFGTVIKRLAEALAAGGAHAGGVGRGAEYDSGSAANVGIKNFFDWFNALTPAERTTIKHYRRNDSSWDNTTMGVLLERLAPTSSINLNDIQYCVELTSGSIQGLLECHPELFNTFPQNRAAVVATVARAGLPQLEADVAAARVRLDRAMKNPANYRVTSTYGDTAKEELNFKIACFLSRSQAGVRQEQERKEADDRCAQVYNRVFAQVSYRIGINPSAAESMQEQFSEFDEGRVTTLLSTKTVDQVVAQLTQEITSQTVEPRAAEIVRARHEDEIQRAVAEHSRRSEAERQQRATNPRQQVQVAEDFTAQRALMARMRAGSQAFIPQAPVQQPVIARPAPALVPQAQAEAARQRQQVREGLTREVTGHNVNPPSGSFDSARVASDVYSHVMMHFARQPLPSIPAIVPQVQVAEDFTARAGSQASIPQASVQQPVVARLVPAVVPQVQADAEARRAQKAANLAKAAEYKRNRR